MKEKLEKKIEAIVDYIINKPENEITLDDYNVLSSELRDIRFREQQAENAKRMRGQRACAYMENAGQQFTRNLVHVGNHQQETL